MFNANKRHTVDEVLTALHLCGPDYHNGACEKCPFTWDCLPGDNDKLIEEAALTIETLLKINSDTLSQQNRIAELLHNGDISVFVVVRKWKNGQEEHRLVMRRFRVRDLDKLGDTVFFKKADAEKELWRLHNGYK